MPSWACRLRKADERKPLEEYVSATSGSGPRRLNARHRAGRRAPQEEADALAETQAPVVAVDDRRRGFRFPRIRTIRVRLALLLAVPSVLLVSLSGLGVVNQYQVAADANSAAGAVELVLATQDLIHSLQRERALTSGLLGGVSSYRTQLDAQRRASDDNRRTLTGLLSRTGSPNSRAVQAALDRLKNATAVRAAADSGQIVRSDVLDFYTNAIVALSTATGDGGAGQHDLALRRGLEALRVLGDAKEAIALERGQLNGVFAQNRFNGDDYLRFTETRAVKLDALNTFRQWATPAQSKEVTTALRSREAGLADSYETHALEGSADRQLNLSAPNWSAAMATVGQDLRAVQRDIGDAVRSRAVQVQREADVLLLLYSLTAGATLLIALLLWVYMFRAIVRPLRTLTGEARDVAERRLPSSVERIQAAEDPDAVIVESGRSTMTRREDEFAEVAEALDNLQRTAIRLATEQAVMRRNTAESLANLGRRNQNLVRRQLGFISALERDEADPNALANLFELDHLATRMRRNAESLLVLVGEHSPRRWSTPVRVGDVLRSAFAEVEDYRRVTLRRADEALVLGSVAAEISHLLAELVENALYFSPPGQEVEVQARSTGSQYHIAIIDQGIGMTPEEMATANARLRNEQSFLVSPTRDLGHYVVGRLAQRLGISVWLHDSPLNGVTARIVLPTALLAEPEQPVQVAAAKTLPQPAAVGGPPAGPAAAATAVAAHSGRPPEHWPPRAPEDGPATTRNGLVKRNPGTTPLRRPIRPVPRDAASGASGAGEPMPERSPEQVQSMLNNFRAGFHGAGESRPGDP